MAFALFRTESDQRINCPIRTNTQRFCLARAVHYQPAPHHPGTRQEPGGKFIVYVEDGQIRLEPIQAAVARAQAIVRRYVPEGISLVDELSEERRLEADRE